MAKRGPKGPSKWTEENIEKLAKRLHQTFNEDHTILIMEELCAREGIPLSYMNRFESNVKFCETKRVLESAITARLFKAAATGEINGPVGSGDVKKAGTKGRNETDQDISHNFLKAIEVTFRKAENGYTVKK